MGEKAVWVGDGEVLVSAVYLTLSSCPTSYQGEAFSHVGAPNLRTEIGFWWPKAQYCPTTPHHLLILVLIACFWYPSLPVGIMVRDILDRLPLELQDLILLNPPFKDVINLRAASPTLLRAYSGENFVKHVKRRLPSDLTLLTMSHKLRA